MTSVLLYSAELFFHLDQHLNYFLTYYGAWVYAVLALIVFCETGLVFTPFLPGDSLIFAAASLSGTGHLNLTILFLCFWGAAVAGDAVNFSLGHRLGVFIFRRFQGKYIKKEYLIRTKDFYRRHGGKTVIIARFIPIIRTFAPFVAGMSNMAYKRFFFFNVLGALLWIGIFCLLGFALGTLPWVKNHWSIIVLTIILVSLLPAALSYLHALWKKNHV